MNRSLLALCVFAFAVQDAAATCIYDPGIDAFRAYDAAKDSALTRETLFGIERPEFTLVNGQRFQRAAPLRGTVEEMNEYLQPRGTADGVRYFGTVDTQGDLIAAIARPDECLLQTYQYAPILHGAWVETQPFVFRFSALVIDTTSVRRDGDRARGIGFLMLGHPHSDEDLALYYRQTLESDCAGERSRIVDTRSYAAGNTLHQRFTDEGKWVANPDLNHPATRVLAQLVCNPPTEWPAGTRLQSLDDFSEQVHAAAHSQ